LRASGGAERRIYWKSMLNMRTVLCSATRSTPENRPFWKVREDLLMRSPRNGALPHLAMNRRSFAKRLEKLEAREVALSYRCARLDDIEQAAKAKMRLSDLETLEEALARRPEDFTAAQRTVWARWEFARAEAVREAAGDATFLLTLSADDWNL
jgi:hypothetical protein